MNRLNDTHEQLYRQLLEYQRSQESVLDVLDNQKDSSFRRLLASRLEVILSTVSDAQRIAAYGSGKKQTGTRTESRVLAVNDELNVVVLDAGRAQGIRLGSSWQITNQREQVTTLRIIELRQSVCVGMITEGKLATVIPGATAVLNIDRRD